jgi:hypothetical protein
VNSLNATEHMAPALDSSRAESGVGLQPSYEAWVIYNFLSLCMAYVGGPGQVLVHMEGHNIKVGCSRHPCHSRQSANLAAWLVRRALDEGKILTLS